MMHNTKYVASLSPDLLKICIQRNPSNPNPLTLNFGKSEQVFKDIGSLKALVREELYLFSNNSSERKQKVNESKTVTTATRTG